MGLGEFTEEQKADFSAAMDEADRKKKEEDDYRAMLVEQAAGRGPSLAADMLKQQTNQNAAATNAIIGSQRGVNAGLAMRQGLQQQATANQNLAGQAQQARTQEQLAAQQALGQNITQSRQLDLQQQNQQNQYALGNRQINAGIEMQNSANTTALWGGLLGAAAAGGSAAAGRPASDERLKKDIGDGDQDAYAFLDALKAHKFNYKNPDGPGAQHGQQLGVMAQDIEQGPGRNMVQDTPDGKMLDPAKGFGSVLAAQANLHERLKKIEGGKGYSEGGYVDYSVPMKKGKSILGDGQDVGEPIGKLIGSAMKKKAGSSDVVGVEDATNDFSGYAAHGALIPGDSKQNDIVPAMLSPGEIVIPRSASGDKEKAKEFIDELMKKKSAKDEPGKSGYAKILEAHRQLGEALKGFKG